MKKLLLFMVSVLLLQAGAGLTAEARKKSRAVAGTSPTLADSLFAQAMRHHLALRPDAEYEMLDECLRQAPDMPEALYYMAKLKLRSSVLLDSATVAAGDSLLMRAYALDSTNEDIRDLLISRLITRRNYAEATALVEKKCARPLITYSELCDLLQLYKLQGRYPEALATVVRLEQIQGAIPETAWERYQIYECTGQREKAAGTIDSLLQKALPDPATSEYMREKLTQHPRYYEVLEELQEQMTAAQDSEDYKAIVELCRKGEMYRPDFLQCYFCEAFNWVIMEDTLQALDACQRGMNYVTLPTDDKMAAELCRLSGDIYSCVDNLEASTECYEMALQIDSTMMMACNNYAYQLALLGRDLDRAERMSRRTLEEDPDNPTYLDTYAWVLHCSGRSKEARQYIDKAIRLNKEDDETLAEHRRAIYQKK